MKIIRCIAFPVLLLCAGCSLFPFYFTSDLTPEVRIGICNRIKELVTASYPFAQAKGVDMDGFRQAVDASLTPIDRPAQDYLDALQEALCLLKDVNTSLVELPYRYTRGVRMRYVPYILAPPEEGYAFVEWCDPATGFQAGDSVKNISNGATPWTTVIGLPTATDLLTWARGLTNASTDESRNRRAANSLLSFVASPMTVDVVRSGADTPVTPVLSSSMSSSFPSDVYGGEVAAGVGYICIPSFDDVSAIDKADVLINGYMSARAIIVDVRGADGARYQVADYVLGRFFAAAPPSFRKKNRYGETVGSLGPSPRGTVYAGTLVVLTDYLTTSAANYFAHQVRLNGRGTLVGEKTGGGAGIPETYRLTPTLTLRVSAVVVTQPDGVTTSEAGIDPDVGMTPVGADFQTDFQNGYFTFPTPAAPPDPVKDLVIAKALTVIP